MTRALITTLLAALTGFTSAAHADDHAVPQTEAFDACHGKTLAADCTLASLDRAFDGLCVIEGQDHLYCLPYELSLPADGYLN